MSRSISRALHRQIEQVHQTVLARVEGLTDEEFLWEPVPGCWTIHPRTDGEEHFNGAGKWIYDYAIPDPEPAPFTTIGWRLVHIASINDMYFEHVFGPAVRDYPDQDIPHQADAAIAWWREGLRKFEDKLDEIYDTELERVVTTPWEVTRSAKEWLQVLVYENVHHGAEIGVLRDLYRYR